MANRIIAQNSSAVPSSAITSQSFSGFAHERRESHKLKIDGQSEEDHYVLTLQTDDAHHQFMSALRKKYFPPKLQKVTAHISLFHALPGSKLPSIRADLALAASRRSPFKINARKPFRMGNRGVGINVAGLEPLRGIFGELQTKWDTFLSDQDRSKFRGHYTVMNKVDEEEVVARCPGGVEARLPKL